MAIQVELADTLALELRKKWAERLAALEQEAASLRRSIAALDAQLGGVVAPAEEAVKQALPTPQVPPGRKRGDAWRVIADYLATVGEPGVSTREISEKTGIAYSTCHVALRDSSSRFKRDSHGNWQLR